jgi:hypothetical protein
MKHLARIFRQVIVIAPILWLLELFQNKLYFLATGKWGWVYPGSPYHWFSFETLPNWGLSVVVIYIVYQSWFMRRYTSTLKRILIIGIMGAILEYANGFAYHHFTGSYLFIWEASKLKYIDFIAIPMWWFNAAIYHFLSCKLLNLQR